MMVSDMVIQILARIGLAPHHETAVGHTKILKENRVAVDLAFRVSGFLEPAQNRAAAPPVPRSGRGSARNTD
jgi:hypothetical protein